ncbi:MAG: hypothetical protein AAF384_05940 [Pseudomonadota bacterium]
MASGPLVNFAAPILRAGGLAAGLAIMGCNSNTVVDAHSFMPAQTRAGDAVVVIGRKSDPLKDPDPSFIECVNNSLLEQQTMPVVKEQKFVDAMYPWFEPSTAPPDVGSLSKLLDNQAVAGRMSDMSVRYLVWIRGDTERVDESGGVSCTVGLGGGGCFGFKSWDDEARYEASIWDITTEQRVSRIDAQTNGTSYLPAIIVPVPMLARVRETACAAMSEQIASHLVGPP